MDTILAVLVGGLYGAGVYMMMRRSIVKLIIGLALLSHGSNLLILLMGLLSRGRPAVISPGQTQLVSGVADPVPQALILTAIVIGFGVLSFTVVLIRGTYKTLQTDDLDDLQTTDTFDPKNGE
ncbi:MAG: Na+/H+ antiporter subunit C [Thermodesulfobacteriota bacterium]|jgi:multicomponent Na+:H+ antiporter subunit C